MTIQLVAITSIRSDAGDALDQYLGVIGPLMRVAGANVIHRYELLDSIAGSNDIQYVSVIEYPDEAAIASVFESEAYQLLAEVKQRAFSVYQVSRVEGEYWSAS